MILMDNTMTSSEEKVLVMNTPIIVDEEEPLIDVDDTAFEPRNVKIRKDKWVTDEFEILDFLGRGKFGEVKRCREQCSGMEFAAKFICAPRPQDKKDVEHEVHIMKLLQHKRLIQLYDAFETRSEMCLILEIIYGGELFDRVISEDFILTEKACVCFMRQICEGLHYMHSRNIIHLDMKPENILCLTRTGNRVKIIDFGLAREYDARKDLRVLFGTPEFMAPEVVQYEPINFGTDMWSVGVICYVLLSGLSPFMGDNDGETLSNVIQGTYDFDYPEFEEISEDAKDLMSRLLVKETKKRITAEQCLEHAWLNRTRQEDDDFISPTLMLSKKRLKKFVYRRKWQKIVNAIIALKRMGVSVGSIRRQEVGNVVSGDDLFSQSTALPLNTTDKTSNQNDERPQTSECFNEESVAVLPNATKNKNLSGENPDSSSISISNKVSSDPLKSSINNTIPCKPSPHEHKMGSSVNPPVANHIPSVEPCDNMITSVTPSESHDGIKLTGNDTHVSSAKTKVPNKPEIDNTKKKKGSFSKKHEDRNPFNKWRLKKSEGEKLISITPKQNKKDKATKKDKKDKKADVQCDKNEAACDGLENDVEGLAMENSTDEHAKPQSTLRAMFGLGNVKSKRKKKKVPTATLR